MNLLLADFIGSSLSRALIAVLTALAVAGIVIGIITILSRRESRLEKRLAGYEMADESGMPVESGGALGAPTTTVVKSAVGVTERLATRYGMLDRVELLLEQADVPVRSAEALFYVPTFAILAFLAVALLASPFLGLFVAIIVLVAPYGVLVYRRDRRLRTFEEQLPDTLVLLAGSMRAGFSFMQGLETIANETRNPMRRELQRVFTEARLGRAVEDALGDVAVRMQSRDLEWTVMAIRIQREVGGNLAQLLDTVADTMTKRERLRREIRTLTAEGRLSAIIVAAFPPLLALLMWLWQPSYIERLFNETIGVVALIGAVVLEVIGFFWLRRIVDIEV